MKNYSLVLDGRSYQTLRDHLVGRPENRSEEAAFLFCKQRVEGDDLWFSPQDSWLLAPEAFASRSEYYLELTSETRAAIIKRAHDLGAFVIELHSHPCQVEAEFSWSDMSGFQQFVPHIRWRLKERPYAALVFTATSFDSLVWDTSNVVAGSCNLVVDGVSHSPTQLTYGALEQRV